MTPATTAPAPVPAHAPRFRTELALTRRAFKQVWISATLWALVFGVSIAASALNYATTFPGRATRLRLAATTGRDRGVAMLLGPVSAIGTVGGYTVYKCFAFLTSIGAVWGLLIATRLLRGEEDAGRWQLVLAGGTRAGRATVATLTALFAAVGVVFAGATAITLLAGRNPDLGFGAGATLLYGLSLTIAPAVFVAVGAVTSQLGRTRRVATSLGMTVFGISFMLRMIADSGESTKWLLWATPFGWTERMRPYGANDPRPLLVAVAVVAILLVGATRLASTRDVGAGVVATSDVTRLRPFGLASPFRLAVRLDAPVLGAWCIGATTAGFAFGVVANVASGVVSSSVGDTLRRFGVHGGSFVLQYFGVAFLLVATIVALLPVSEISAAAEDESSGRLVHLLAQPVRRTTLLGGRVALAAVATVTTGLLTGVAAWLGAKTQGVDPGLGRMAGAGLNVVPTALVVLGIGVLVLAVAPRASTGAVYGVVVGSLVIDLLTALVSGTSWLDRFSLFHYMALAPSDHTDARTVAITLAAAVGLCVLALGLFERRDLRTN